MSTTTVTVTTSPANRKELAEAFGQNQSAVRRIESMTKDITVNLPDAIDNTSGVAQEALDLAQALQQVAFVIARASAAVPNADVLGVGTGLSLTVSPNAITIALSIPVSVQNGGTGVQSLVPHAVPIGNGVNAPNFAAPGTARQVLTSNGATADPSFQATVNSILAGVGINVSSATGNVTVGLQSPVSLANGGTNATTAASALANLGGVPSSTVGAANGVAGLDVSGKVPLSQLPASVVGSLNYQGTWNASTNTPTLASGTGTKGYFYKVSVAGTTTIDGISQWNVGDIIAFDGTTWDKIDGIPSEVTSVNGQVGPVTITAAGIGAAQTANNLSDLASASAARGNLGLGTAAIQNVTYFLQAANNLSDLASAPTARSNLGLGTMATQSAGAVAITGGNISGTPVSGSTGSFTTVATSGAVGIGAAPAASVGVSIALPVTGGASAQSMSNTPVIQAAVTTSASINYAQPSTVAAAFALTEINYYDALQGTFGSGSTVTNQYGFRVRPTLVGATNNYAFRGQIPSGAGRWNMYMDGTAANYLAGHTLLGSSTDDGSGNALQVNTGISIAPATTTTAPSSGGAGALPATPTGYFTINIGGTARKVAYY